MVVREDEPSTIIAYTLSCHDYAARLHMMQNPDVDDSADEKSLAQASIAGGSTVDLPSEKGNGTHFVDPTPSDIRETLSRVPPYHMGYSMLQEETREAALSANFHVLQPFVERRAKTQNFLSSSSSQNSLMHYDGTAAATRATLRR